MVHRRFFVTKSNISGKFARITDKEDINHIRSVLRLKRGDRIILLDGEGSEYEAIFYSFTGKEIQLKLTIPPIIHPRPKVESILFQGLPKGPKMDLIIQKATELGISRIIPLITSRSLPIGKDGRRIIRWQRIGREAASQSGRAYLPLIETPVTLDELFDSGRGIENGLSILLYEGEERIRLRDILRKGLLKVERINVFIGPEGGFTEGEIKRLKDYGALTCTLGCQLLRTETAAIVTLSIVLYELDMIG